MSLTIKQRFTRNLLNIPGWCTKHKIVVIESDDWGSIRMSSKESFLYLQSIGYPVDQCPYNSYDALESEEDLTSLFEVLNSVKDKNGLPAKLTANSVVANPDFDKIAQNDFQEYFYEPFTETYKRYPNHSNSFNLFRQGIVAGVVMPQFHNREHLNVKRWMRSLHKRNQGSLDAFTQRMFSVHQFYSPSSKSNFMNALDFDNANDADYIESVVKDGLILFKKIWGFHSTSFIANCYTWHSTLEKILAEEGVKYIQGTVVQKEPVIKSANKENIKYNRKLHYQGQKNRLGQRYLIRNAYFEPSQIPAVDWISDCLNRIETAFRYYKPAIISSHRVNFIGAIVPGNRERTLKLFKQLLSEIVKKWPDVEFMSSDQLGDLMEKEGAKK